MDKLERASNKTWTPIRNVAERYNIHVRTIERWIEDPALLFPKPLYIRGRRYFKTAEIQAWEDLQPDRLGSTKATHPPNQKLPSSLRAAV
jgi:hypothetical protein